MISLSHILVLSQDAFIERQVRSALNSGGGCWRSVLRSAARRLSA